MDLPRARVALQPVDQRAQGHRAHRGQLPALQKEGRAAGLCKPHALSYSDIGDKNDWSRWGRPGFAQRFQMHEPLKQTTKKGKTKWYRIGYFIDNDVNTEKHTISLFDFKMLYGKTDKAPVPTLSYNNNVFQWMFNGPNYRVMDNEVGEQYYFDGIGVSLDEKFQAMKGKWVNVLINAKWAEDGFLHLWIDGKLRSSYFGDVLGGASRVRFKFGPYRNYMTCLLYTSDAADD